MNQKLHFKSFRNVYLLLLEVLIFMRGLHFTMLQCGRIGAKLGRRGCARRQPIVRSNKCTFQLNIFSTHFLLLKISKISNDANKIASYCILYLLYSSTIGKIFYESCFWLFVETLCFSCRVQFDQFGVNEYENKQHTG